MKYTGFISDSSLVVRQTRTVPSSSMIAKVLLLPAVRSESESQINSGWKGPLQVIWNNHLPEVGPAQVMFVQGLIQTRFG